MNTLLTEEQIKAVSNWAETYKTSSPDRILLGRSEIPHELRPFVATQVVLQKRWKQKFPSLAPNKPFFFPTKKQFEQASSEATARFKSAFVESRHTLLDLTGGAGIDFLFMVSRASKAFYFEKEPSTFQATRYNLTPYADQLPPTTFLCSEAETFLNHLQSITNPFVYLDPSRRNKSGHRTFLFEETTPNPIAIVSILEKHLPQAEVLIKLSPLIDIEAALLAFPSCEQLYVVAVENEVKEILLHLPSLKSRRPPKGIPLNAISLNTIGAEEMNYSFTRKMEEEGALHYASELKEYLYLPHPAILKAGGFKSIAQRFALDKLHPNSHLYTASEWVANFPGKTFSIEEVIPFNLRKIKALKGKLPPAEVSVRNFSLSAEELSKRLGLKPATDKRLFATTLHPHQQCLIVSRPL